jgi:tetratricopeptide (TPR) repeat protein
MNPQPAAHLWVRGGRRADRERYLTSLRLPPPLIRPDATATGPGVMDSHRRLRGPYTAAGTVLRALVPGLLADAPALVRRHEVEILSIAPELRDMLPATRDTLTSLAVPAERTRFYSRLRTLRMAHGVAELLRDIPSDGTPRSLVVESVEHADPTDAELLSVLLRRLGPGQLCIVVCAGDDLPAGPLAGALARHATAHPVQQSTVDVQAASTGDVGRLAAEYVQRDGTSDDPVLRAGYDGCEPAERARLHDARAGELAGRSEESLRLGAIPYHLEHGSDPAGAGTDALRHALDYCIDMGFYAATIELGERGRAVIDWAAEIEHWWAFTTKMTTSLAALGRAAEAEELYLEARAFTDLPRVHRSAAYAIAMLYTRHHDAATKDQRTAKAWINLAIALAGLAPDPAERAFNSAFMRNGLALVEMHMGNLEESLRLVDDGLARMERELAPGEHQLHRSVLRYNRAQVYAGLGRLDEALADHDAVIAADSNYAEYYFDRGNLYRRLGRDDDALADYETAMRLSPPFPEVYYNRADLLLSRGDTEAGLAGLNDVLDIDPDFIDALVNRAGLLAGLGQLDAARRDVDAGLALAPDHPHLLCVLGQLHAAGGRTAAALGAFDAALATAPALAAAWAGRAAAAFDAGDTAAALADLNRALELGEDPALLFNRATALQAVGRWPDALADLDRALELDPTDPDVRTERDRCRSQLTAGV